MRREGSGIAARKEVCEFSEENGREDGRPNPHTRAEQPRFGGGGTPAEIEHHNYKDEQDND